MSFLRLSDLENKPENKNTGDEEYMNVLGMIVTKITRTKTPNDSIKIQFSIAQTEHDRWTRVTYISTCPEEELKFCWLYQPIGTICFLSTCLRDGVGLELFYEDEMAAVVFRPNEFQVNEFFKVLIIILLLYSFILEIMLLVFKPCFNSGSIKRQIQYRPAKLSHSKKSSWHP